MSDSPVEVMGGMMGLFLTAGSDLELFSIHHRVQAMRNSHQCFSLALFVCLAPAPPSHAHHGVLPGVPALCSVEALCWEPGAAAGE